ncbi:secondary thiamine-phosphate synthase enzyme YjbQ [Labrenzia sp. CE80]|uniref:secondary thiamine-phosphate synthase enzyme YjbQ n=1 Tax=Labrenzia sp. CE80 TaxID=1788986 RepID=UPI001AD92018|nr:secondary thiamine-phosphate synthase enzyme YjbQ [Labrenzia sp. CE80]
MTLNPIGVWTLDGDGTQLRQAMGRLVVSTGPRGFHSLTEPVNRWLAENAAGDGLLTLFLRHTSASLVIQENTDPDVQADLVDALDRLAPEDVNYRHSLEGLDDMPAHVKTMLTGVSLQVPVVGGRLDLGTWQAIYLTEHRAQRHQRSVTMHYFGT